MPGGGGSNTLEIASHCAPAPQLGEHPWPCTPDPPLCQCLLWETHPVAKGGGIWKQQEFPSSSFHAGLGAQWPANPLSSRQPCRNAVPHSEEPRRGLSPYPWLVQKPGSFLPLQQHAPSTPGEDQPCCWDGPLQPATSVPLNAACTLPGAVCSEKAQQWVLAGTETCPPPPPGPPGPCTVPRTARGTWGHSSPTLGAAEVMLPKPKGAAPLTIPSPFGPPLGT